MTFSTPDLQELDRIWPLGRELVVPDNGVIFVAGAWHGRYCRYLSERFPKAQIYGFEPQRPAWQEAILSIQPYLTREFPSYLNVNVYPVGIGLQNSIRTMFDVGTDGCSLVKRTGETTQALLVESCAIRSWLDVQHVALAVINMEGYEYSLLADWLKHGEIEYYDSIAIQFHPSLASIDENANTDPLVHGLSKHYGQPKYFDYPSWALFQKQK